MDIEMTTEDGLYHRQTLFDKAKRVVVKVGSAILTSENGINKEVLDNLAKELAFLRNTGREVILVSSGAVAAGKKKLHIKDGKGVSIMEKQALAAIGQSQLMHDYDEAFHRYGYNIAQILLTHSDLAHRSRYLNVRNTIHTLFKFGVIPIINENDTVSTEELKFSDNDTLGAMLANLIEADMFICLTDVDALYDSNPVTHPDAKPIYTVSEVDDRIQSMAGHSKSVLGTGGMQSKINAAQMVSAGGGSSFIGPGKRENILEHLFSGEMIGTFFLPQKEKMQSRKRWIAYVLKPQGEITLDAGACTAIAKNGRSLLPSGVTDVHGDFNKGDSVRCVNTNGDLVAVGLSNFSKETVAKIKGLRTKDITQLLGYIENEEIIHRDNMVVL